MASQPSPQLIARQARPAASHPINHPSLFVDVASAARDFFMDTRLQPPATSHQPSQPQASLRNRYHSCQSCHNGRSHLCGSTVDLLPYLSHPHSSGLCAFLSCASTIASSYPSFMPPLVCYASCLLSLSSALFCEQSRHSIARFEQPISSARAEILLVVLYSLLLVRVALASTPIRTYGPSCALAFLSLLEAISFRFPSV
jgi:hypothetical protein